MQLDLQAIVLKRENKEKIQEKIDIDDIELGEMFDELDKIKEVGEHLIVYMRTALCGRRHMQWMTMPLSAFDVWFKPANMKKMETRFVNIKEKPYQEYVECDWCNKSFVPGEQMYSHKVSEHRDELDKMGAVLSKENPYKK